MSAPGVGDDSQCGLTQAAVECSGVSDGTLSIHAMQVPSHAMGTLVYLDTGAISYAGAVRCGGCEAGREGGRQRRTQSGRGDVGKGLGVRVALLVRVGLGGRRDGADVAGRRLRHLLLRHD